MRFQPILASSLALALAPALLAQRLPEVEPNDTPGSAQVIPVGVQIDCSLVAASQDWYSFTLASNTRIRIHTSSAPSTVTPFGDTRIALLDSTGTTYLGIDDDARGSTNGWTSDLTMNVAAGTYTVQVVGFASTSAGPYSIEISELTPVVYDGVEVEPNDSHLTATPTNVLPAGGATRYLGNLGPTVTVATDLVGTGPIAVSTDLVPPTVIQFSGTVVSSTTTIITTTGLTASTFGNTSGVQMTSGVNVGLVRGITSNTATTVTTAAWPVANGPGDTFDIITINTTAITRVTTPLPLSLYAGAGYNLRMTSGANVGLSRGITANNVATITTAVFPVANAPGDSFDIDAIGSTRVVLATTPLVAGSLNGPGLALLIPQTGFGRYQVTFTSGANAGLVRQVLANTAGSLTLETALTAVPTAGDTFSIDKVDVDFYQVVMTAPTHGIWFQINEGDAPFVYGHRYEIYDAAGLPLAPQTSTTGPAFGTNFANSSLTAARTSQIRVWPAGTYNIVVRSPQVPAPAGATMPSGLIPSGNYMLELFSMPMDTLGTVAEAEAVGTQSNNTIATAQPIAPGQTGQGHVTISTGTDPSDWWGPIVISTPSTFTYQTRQGAVSPTFDTSVVLKDSTGATVATSTIGNLLSPTSHGRGTISFFLTPATYYLEVLSPGTAATQTGNYELQISAVVPAPYVTASYALFAANATCGTAPFPTLTNQWTTGATAGNAETPLMGSTFSRDLRNCPPTSIYIHMIGFSNTLYSGSVPLPADLTFLGAPGCTLNVDPVILVAGLTDAAGIANLMTVLPPITAFRGFVWYEQAIVNNPAANAFGAQFSNYGRVITGERSF